MCVKGRCAIGHLSRTARQRIPQMLKEVDGAVSGGCDQVSQQLPVLVSFLRTIQELVSV